MDPGPAYPSTSLVGSARQLGLFHALHLLHIVYAGHHGALAGIGQLQARPAQPQAWPVVTGGQLLLGLLLGPSAGVPWKATRLFCDTLALSSGAFGQFQWETHCFSHLACPQGPWAEYDGRRTVAVGSA